MDQRRKARIIQIGNRFIGGDYPVLVQSMTKCDTRDVKATVGEIKRLESAGCEIIRVAVPDEEAAHNLSHIKKQISIPLVADIHFNWRLAMEAIVQGVDKVRIGYRVIGSPDKAREILKFAKEREIPVRIGVNAGSLDNDIRQDFGQGVEAMVESAMRYIKLCEDSDFFNIVVSMKSSNALETIRAYKILAERVDYPLHLGVTNAGTDRLGIIKSVLAIGSLLERGIGDTIRVSLTGPSVEEVKVGREILRNLGLQRRGIEVISCPTCGRLEIDEEYFTKIVKETKEALASVGSEFPSQDFTVSIIGCAVNGPGEAAKADLGVMIIDKERAVLFREDKIIKRISISGIKDEVLDFYIGMLENVN